MNQNQMTMEKSINRTTTHSDSNPDDLGESDDDITPGDPDIQYQKQVETYKQSILNCGLAGNWVRLDDIIGLPINDITYKCEYCGTFTLLEHLCSSCMDYRLRNIIRRDLDEKGLPIWVKNPPSERKYLDPVKFT